MMTMRGAVLATAWLLLSVPTSCAFTTTPILKSKTLSRHSQQQQRRPLFASTSALEEAQALKAQAERMRLEAEMLDAKLTLQKVESLEKKLNDRKWRERHADEEQELRAQLQDLNNKIQGKPPERRRSATTAVSNTSTIEAKKEIKQVKITETSRTESPRRRDMNPIAGFSAEDLDLYLPVAQSIEANMTEATMEEKLDAFRTTPELQEHFSAKIQALLVQPMQDLQHLERAKRQYLESTSSVEKEQLLREIDQLEAAMEKESSIFSLSSSTSSVFKGVPSMTDDELQERIQALEALPEVMQCLYKKRNDVPLDSPVSRAILVEHYEPQLQLLEQVPLVAPLDEESRQEAICGYESMPSEVQQHFLKDIGIESGLDAAAVIKELEGGADELNLGFGKVVVEAAKAADLPEYSDIQFVDRSRYVEEFLPAFARMEDTRPTSQEIETFLSQVLDKNTFVLTSKPERVMGGYYLRGENKCNDNGDTLVEKLSEKLAKSCLKDDVQFFYIPDPTQLTDEEIESGIREKPILAISSKNPNEFYSLARPQTKFLVSSLGIVSTFVFALGACGMNGDMMDRVQQGLDSGNVDVSWFAGAFFTTFVSMLGIQLAHEIGHRIVAWKDKVRAACSVNTLIRCGCEYISLTALFKFLRFQV